MSKPLTASERAAAQCRQRIREIGNLNAILVRFDLSAPWTVEMLALVLADAFRFGHRIDTHTGCLEHRAYGRLRCQGLHVPEDVLKAAFDKLRAQVHARQHGDKPWRCISNDRAGELLDFSLEHYALYKEHEHSGRAPKAINPFDETVPEAKTRRGDERRARQRRYDENYRRKHGVVDRATHLAQVRQDAAERSKGMDGILADMVGRNLSYAEMAAELNGMGRLTARGKPFTKQICHKTLKTLGVSITKLAA